MEDDEYTTSKMGEIKLEEGAPNGAHVREDGGAYVPTTNGIIEGAQSPAVSLRGVKSRSGSADTPGSNKPPRLSRKASQKAVARDPLLFSHLPDVTAESCKAFQLIPDCLYGSKHLGSTDSDSLDCECREEWRNGENFACGEDSDCINRATKMECTGAAGNCGGGCQNQRFQRKQYANVTVIKTEKKGFGLRADSDLQVHDFVFEYIGEVINEPTFRRRMVQYDQEGIKHFYFMSLNKSEFVDATKKGNLGRFCNHSCNPNCYVDKWVVGDKLRMGIFAQRRIQAGEELVFNYNVDRYGADPQPCYCGEANCVGFIGGKTQTERATKLPAVTAQALGIDAVEDWDTSVVKKPRRKRPEEDDEDYVNSIQPRTLTKDDASKVMAALVQCKEKWVASKLLERIEQCEDERVIHRVMQMHAYQILKPILKAYQDDANLVLQVLSILDKFPRLTRNKIQDSKIEAALEPLTESDNDYVASKSKKLLQEWSKLEVGYRIQRRKFDPNAPAPNSFEERRGRGRDEDHGQTTPKTVSPRTIDAPKGPRNSAPQRSNSFFHNGPRQPRRQPYNAPLPQGWFAAKDAAGNTYFYNKQGATTWQRPTQPAIDPVPKAPSKAMQEQLLIQNIIDKVTKEGTPKQTVQTPKATEPPVKESKKEKWRSLPIEKQQKIYENTLFPHVKYVLDKFHHKLPKDELKRLGKDVAKKLVASDYKNNRVEDPSAPLSDRQAKKMKKYVHDYLERALQKWGEHQKRKAARELKQSQAGSEAPGGGDKPGVQPVADLDSPQPKESATPADDAGDVMLTDNEGTVSSGSPDRKRKRDVDGVDSPSLTPSDAPLMKRLREDETGEPSPPPPPPPPPEGAMEEVISAEQQALREQEEALMRENEEAQRLEDEAKKNNELANALEPSQADIANAAKELTAVN